MDKLKKRKLCDVGPSEVTFGSFMNWLGYVFDLSCDIFYYVVMSFDYPAVQYIMLASMIAPLIINLVMITRASPND